MNNRQRRHRNCVGTSTLEFIVILPFLLCIMLVAVELSRMLATYNVIVQASREGARTAVVDAAYANATNVLCNSGSTNLAVVRACVVTGTVPSMDPAGVSVTVNCVAPTGTCKTDNQVTVSVTTTFTSVFAGFFDWVIGGSALSSVNLQHATAMRYE